MEKRGGRQQHKALSLRVRRQACFITSHPQLQSRDVFFRYQVGYRFSHHMNERWEIKDGQRDDSRTPQDGDARVQQQQQRMSVPLVVIVGGVGAVRIGAGHSSGTQ